MKAMDNQCVSSIRTMPLHQNQAQGNPSQSTLCLRGLTIRRETGQVCIGTYPTKRQSRAPLSHLRHRCIRKCHILRTTRVSCICRLGILSSATRLTTSRQHVVELCTHKVCLTNSFLKIFTEIKERCYNTLTNATFLTHRQCCTGQSSSTLSL